MGFWVGFGTSALFRFDTLLVYDKSKSRVQGVGTRKRVLVMRGCPCFVAANGLLVW